MTDKITAEISKIEQRRKDDAAKLRRLQRQRKKQQEAELRAAKLALVERLSDSVGATTVGNVEELERRLFDTGRDKVLHEELSWNAAAETEASVAESHDTDEDEEHGSSIKTDDTVYPSSGDHVSSESGDAGYCR